MLFQRYRLPHSQLGPEHQHYDLEICESPKVMREMITRDMDHIAGLNRPVSDTSPFSGP